MTDKKLDELKDFLDGFKDLEDFRKRYVVHHPGNEEALIQYFNQAKAGADTWQLSKIFNSIESIRLDKLYRNNHDISISEYLEELEKYDLSKFKRVVIKLNNSDYDKIDKLADIGIDVDVLVQGSGGFCTLKEFKAMRNFFNDFVHRYDTFQLSTLEIITLAYDYVKFFSFNEENTEMKTDSRSLARCIATGNIVCEGYAKMFSQLLKEFGINSTLMMVEPTSEESNGHVRVVLRVDDDKYNIHDNFIFDPTWDSDRSTKLVCDAEGHEYYKSESLIKPEETILRDTLSDLRYLFFMIPIEEFKKYFPKDNIEKIVKYPSNEKIILNEDLQFIFNYNDKKGRDNTILTYLEDLLRKTKKVEGYNDEQIEVIIGDAIGIMKQYRFGLWDVYANKGTNR